MKKYWKDTTLKFKIGLGAGAVFMVGCGAIVAGAGADPPGGPHTPVTICHKPGTPAEMTLVVDDDAVPGHLGHGDTLGPCETPPPTTTVPPTTTEPPDRPTEPPTTTVSPT